MIGFAISGVMAAIVAITVLFGSWYTVDQGERGVLTRNGKIVGTATPGLGFKVPLVDDVTKVNIKTQTTKWDKMNAYSYDQQPADLNISVTLHANPETVTELYSRFGTLAAYVTQRVSPHVNQQVKVVFGQYTAVKAIQARGKLNTDIKDAIVTSMGDDGMVVVESVQVENIEFSATYLHSIEQRMLAEVEVQKLQQNAEREKVQAQITVTQANAKADSVRAEAKANADAITLKGNAEASAIDARGKALGINPNLVTLVQAEKWNGVLPTTMVPSSTLPFINVK